MLTTAEEYVPMLGVGEKGGSRRGTPVGDTYHKKKIVCLCSLCSGRWPRLCLWKDLIQGLL